MNRIILIAAAVLSTSSLLLMDSAIKGGVLLLLAALVALARRRDSAATRHLVWHVSIVGMLVVPVFSAVLPQWRVLPAWAIIPATPAVVESEPVQIERPATTLVPQAPLQVALPPFSSEANDLESDHAVPAVTHQPSVDVPAAQSAVVPAATNPWLSPSQWNPVDVLPGLWLIGFSVLMLRLMAARWMLWSGERRGTVMVVSQKTTLSDRTIEPSDEAIISAFRAACQQLAVSRPVRLLIHAEQSIPVVWGIIRLRLLLPESARTWSSEQLQSVILHELAHIKRRDAIAQLLAQTACALHWFNPLVWFASWRLHVERERACDDLVLASGVRPSDYAKHLLDVATRLSPARWTQACGLAMARKSSLEGRLVAVLSQKSNRRSVSASVAALALLVGFGIAVPVAMLRPTDAVSAGEVNPQEASSSAPASLVPKKEAVANETPPKYGPQDWAGWFTNQVSHRRLKDGTYPSLAFKYLREYVAEDLSEKPNTAGDDGVRDWLELTAAEKNSTADEFTAMVARIATWDLTVVQRAMSREEFVSRCFPKPGRPATPSELRGVSFGPTAENGLRVAWVFDPAKNEYAVGETLNCRVVVHNTGSQPVQFLGGLDSQDGEWSIRDAAGKPIPTKALPQSNVWLKPRMFPYQRFRLEPGHIVELAGQGVGIGDGDRSAAQAQVLIWQIIETHTGDTVQISVETTLGLSPLPEHLSHPFYTRDEFPEEQARDWFGTLRSGKVKFNVVAATADPPPFAAATEAAAPAAVLTPQHEDALKLFNIWQSNARTDGKIPGALIGRLGEWVKYFIELNDGAGESGELTSNFKKLLPRFDASHDWTQADAVALLNDVAAVHRIPFNNALGAAAERVILPGDPLPAELKNVSWGRRDASGLRVAWYLRHEDDLQTLQVEPHKQPGVWRLVPSPRTYQLGSVFKSRILVHNAGAKSVFFVMPSWQQSSTHAAHDDKGASIKVSATEWTTMAQMRMYRLAPGAYLETSAPGIGVGSGTSNEDWAGLRPGAWIHAKAGDEVRLTPGNVEVRVSPFVVGTRHLNRFQKPKDAEELWDSVVAERVSREMPIPVGAADREQLLRRVVRDLYGVDPEQSEIDVFVADMSPGALHPVTGEVMLRDRVKHNRKMSSFTGTLPPGAMTFRVLAADPHAGNRTRVATGPGYYILGDNQRLHVEQSREGNQMRNKATIQFFSNASRTNPPPKPVEIALRDGLFAYTIAWDRGAGILWITQKGMVRKYDFTDPAHVQETRFSGPDKLSKLPPSIFDATHAALNVPGAPVQQMQVPKPDGGTKLEPGMAANFKWGATVNGLRAALSLRRTPDEPDDLYVVIQNVSDAPIHVDGAAADSRKLWIRLKGATQMALSAKDPARVDVMLQPREVAFVRVFSPESAGPDGRAFSAIIAESALKDPNWTMTVEFAVEQAPTGSWQGKLRTADTSGSEAAKTTTKLEQPGKPFEKVDAPQPQSGTKLEPGRKDNLQWGEPVNGLRAALIRPPALGSPESTQTKDFQMVIQNVSKAPIRLVADATAPNPRHLTLTSRKHGWVQSRTRVEEPSDVDFLLQPGEVAVLDLLPSAGHQGSSISRNLDLLFFGDMTIEKAPPGAWTGTLLTAEMHAAFAAHGLLPTHKDAREVFKIWNQGARLDRTMPGALIGLLADSVTLFTKSNPAWKTTPQLLQLLPRLDATRDWEPHDVVTLLDEVAAMQASPVAALLENELAKVMRRGKPLPKELASAPWGEAQPNGLRLAWLLEPQRPEVGIGTALKSRILIHNAGKGTVVFRARNWHQSNDHKARDADGADVTLSSTRWLTRTQVVPFRLNPGDYVELPAAAIGVGPRGDGAAWKNSRAGSWIEAKPGDEVTFQPASVALGVGEPDSVLNGDGSWWPRLVTARLHREMPVPEDNEVRRRLLFHVGLDLGTSNSDEIVNAFLADRQPNALDTLAKRLAEHTSPVPFAGSLVSGPTKFHVVAAATVTNQASVEDHPDDAPDTKPAPAASPAPAATEAEAAMSEPEAADRPKRSDKGPVRSANHSGNYQLSNQRRLTVCRPTPGEPWLAMTWDESKAWPASWLRIYPKVSVENRRNWVVVWEADSNNLWYVDDVAITHVDVSSPAEVLTTRQEFAKPAVLDLKFPEPVRQEFKRLGYDIARSKQSTDGYITDGQAMLTAESAKQWVIEGTVTGADGKPMTDVPIRARTQYHPTIDVVTTKTDAKGNYRLSFRLDLRTLARFRGVCVVPTLDGFTERDAENAGLFEALLYPGEKPQHAVIREYPPMWITGSIAGENEPGPINRFSDRDLIIDRPARADFVMLPASTIAGVIVDPDGKPLPSHYVSVSAPDTIRPRGYETIAYAQSDENGRFTLKDIPADEVLNFTTSLPGRNWDVSRSASQIFGAAATYRIRIVTGPGGTGASLRIERNGREVIPPRE